MDGDEIAAEPVPVRLPGVEVIGFEERKGGVDRAAGKQTGRTKIGLKLPFFDYE